MASWNFSFALVVMASFCAAGDKLIDGTIKVDGTQHRPMHATAYERPANGKVLGTVTVRVNGKVQSDEKQGEPSDGTVVIILASTKEITDLQFRASTSPSASATHPFLELTIDKRTGKVLTSRFWTNGYHLTSLVSSTVTNFRVSDGKVHGKVVCERDDGFNFEFHIPLRDAPN